MRKRYPSDLTDEQWQRIAHIFEPSTRGRPRQVAVNAARTHEHRALEATRRSGEPRAGKRSRVKVLQELVERYATAQRLALLKRQVAADPGLLEPNRRHSSPCLGVMLSNPYFRAVLAPLRAPLGANT